jgi:hypothetical protein
MEAFVADLVLEGGDRFLSSQYARKTGTHRVLVEHDTRTGGRQWGVAIVWAKQTTSKRETLPEDYVVGFLYWIVGAERSAELFRRSGCDRTLSVYPPENQPDRHDLLELLLREQLLQLITNEGRPGMRDEVPYIVLVKTLAVSMKFTKAITQPSYTSAHK